jgi:hypothetical protein
MRLGWLRGPEGGGERKKKEGSLAQERRKGFLFPCLGANEMEVLSYLLQ